MNLSRSNQSGQNPAFLHECSWVFFSVMTPFYCRYD